MINNLIGGMQILLQPECILALVIGVIVGIVIGIVKSLITPQTSKSLSRK